MERASTPFKPRLLAVLEGLALFGLAVLLFSGLRHVQGIRAWEEQVLGVPFVEYLAVLLLSPAVLLLARRDFPSHGLSFRPLCYHLDIFAAAFLPVFLLSAALSWIPWRQWPGAVWLSVVEVGLLALTARLLRGKPALGAAILFPLLLAPLPAGDPVRALLRLGSAYLLVAPAEEALFRGCIQSRLNLAFGRPYYTWGIRWGWGLLITSALFGLWHLALNPTAASAGPHALWTFFAGLIFGAVREKSGSIAAPALLHGVLNYGPQALLYDLFV
jgi:membrane protease YdiL (CAAX protease family)